MDHKADRYEAVRKYDILRGYLEHFRGVSINNEIPGLLSFFFIQGQCALPYVRLPMGGGNLDPRVSVFWIQDTRTGKSVAYEIIGKIMKDSGMEAVDCSVGTDAAMIGSFTKDEPNGPARPQYGVLKGRKGLNFDEGSILLKPGQHSENLVLFLQTALNAAGTGRNRLVKHMKDGTLDYLSYVSLWITTYPPDGIKDYVLTKGIFQRVLHKPALNEAIEGYYSLVEDMDPKKQNICTSFIMGLQNYTNVIAHHMAMLEETWVVTGVHVDISKEILHDLYKNLLHWLEDEVKVGMSQMDMKKEARGWKEAMARCEKMPIENKGLGWVKKKELLNAYGQINNLSSETGVRNRFNKMRLFDHTKTTGSNKQYVRFKEEV
jgi:hypothetical protein